MLSWISNQLSPSLSVGPHADLKQRMKDALAFEAVLTPPRELEYKFLMEQICRSSFDMDERMIILDFLHYSFAPVDPNGEWRTIFNGLRILNALVDSGSNKIIAEVSEGKHFDVVQKTLFLTTYANSDERVGKLIRTAAKEIRDKLLKKFDLVQEESVDESQIKSISSRDSGTPVERPAVPSSLAHIVALKHVEDSDDEEAAKPRKILPQTNNVTESLLDIVEPSARSSCQPGQLIDLL